MVILFCDIGFNGLSRVPEIVLMRIPSSLEKNDDNTELKNCDSQIKELPSEYTLPSAGR